MQLSIDDVADIVSKNLSVPLTMRWMDKRDVANALGVSISYVEKVSVRPGFPESYRLPSSGRGSGSRRWKATDIAEWMETLREGKRK